MVKGGGRAFTGRGREQGATERVRAAEGGVETCGRGTAPRAGAGSDAIGPAWGEAAPTTVPVTARRGQTWGREDSSRGRHHTAKEATAAWAATLRTGVRRDGHRTSPGRDGFHGGRARREAEGRGQLGPEWSGGRYL